MKNLSFPKNKFLKLNTLQKHKKCFELLRIIYEKILKKEDKKDIEEAFSKYNLLLSWLNLSFFKTNSLKDISDKYHYHLQKAKFNLKEHNLLPKINTQDRDHAKEDFLKNAIYLDNVRSAYNVGSIIRTTEALRIGSLYFSEKTPFIDNNKVIKTSMKTSTIVPCEKIDLNSLKTLPRPFIALETAENAISIYEFLFPKEFTLILGNEEYGISEKLLKEANYVVDIPMVGMKNSINIACAYAIASCQIKKQSFFDGK